MFFWFFLIVLGCGGGTSSEPAPATELVKMPETVSLPADQTEVSQNPAKVNFKAAKSTPIRLGIHALQPLVVPELDGVRLASFLPAGATLTFDPNGTGTYSYSDSFDSHYRGRTPNFTDDSEDLLSLTFEAARPRVLDDLHAKNVQALTIDRQDRLRWNGDLTYRFNIGHQIRSVALSTPDGQKTTFDATGSALEVFSSFNGRDWTSIWKAEKGQSGTIDAAVPDELLGRSTIFIKFSGEDVGLGDLHFSAMVDGTALKRLLTLEGKEQKREFTVKRKARALIFWEGQHVQPANDRKTESPDAAEIETGPRHILTRFPQGVYTQLRLSETGGIKGIQRLAVDGEALLALGSTTSTHTYLQNDAGKVLDLARATFVDTKTRGKSVVMNFAVDEQGQQGTVAWVFTPTKKAIEGHDWQGASWHVEVEGLTDFNALQTLEPTLIRYGGWSFAQTSAGFAETRQRFATPLTLPDAVYGTDIQPLYFAAGSYGAVASFFESPVEAQVSIDEDASRHWLTTTIPLDEGKPRKSVPKLWLWRKTKANDLWKALDLWTDAAAAVGMVELKGEGTEDLKGREYGLYRRSAPVAEATSYFRAIAAGAVPIDGAALAGVAEDQKTKVEQANKDLQQVAEHMGRRQLIGEEEKWQGVWWTNGKTGHKVLFAFTTFSPDTKGFASILDVTSGEGRETLTTEAWHTYLLSPK